MADYDSLMRAAGNADRAGDETAARRLVQAAIQAEQGRVETAGGVPRLDAPQIRKDGGPEIDGPFDTIKSATEGPLQAVAHYAGQAADSNRTLPQRAGDVGMTALAGLGTAYAGAAGAVGEVLGGSPTNEKKLARDLMMAGAVAVPELAGVSSTARIAGSSARAVNKPIPEPKNRIEAGKRAADDLGVTPSLGSGGKVRAMTAGGLEKVPLAGDAIAKDAVRFVDEIEAVAAKVKAKVGTASVPSEAGQTLQSGLLRYVERSKEKASQMYDEVGKHIPADSPVSLDSTTSAVRASQEAFAQNPKLAESLGLNKWNQILTEAGENGINWQALRQFRTQVGEAIGSSRGALADESAGRLKALYEALTQDMNAAAQAAGPQAQAAWTKANDFYRRFAQRTERSLDKTIKADSPERAFEAFANMAKADASSASVNRMRQIKASMKPSEWGDVSASIIDRLGRPSKGARDADGGGFSANSFLTQWNSMSDEAKRLLLPGRVREELQQVADVAQMAREAGLERNFSNTGNVVAGSALGVSAMNAPILTSIVAGGTWGSAKAMTSPVFLRALNKASRGDTKQLKAMADGRGPFAEDARTIMQITAAETAATSGANQNANPLRAAQ